MLRTALVTAFGLALLAAPLVASAGAPAVAAKDPSIAIAGTYKLDENHISVIARVPHRNGVAFSTFRFERVHGTVAWDPKAPAATKIDVTVEPASITSVAKGFATELAGDRFLKTAMFPEAKFVSTGVRMVNPTHAMVDGNMTFLGVTKPVVLDAELVGVGPGAGGKFIMGVMGTMRFKRSDFGFNAMVGPVGDDITVQIDGEFGGQ